MFVSEISEIMYRIIPLTCGVVLGCGVLAFNIMIIMDFIMFVAAGDVPDGRGKKLADEMVYPLFTRDGAYRRAVSSRDVRL
ncbi:TPA: hypothetical protein ACKP1B_001888 [Serratia fonticola]